MPGAAKTLTRAAEVTNQRRLQVWGDPIAHSRSPQLHAAAYSVLGLAWQYGRRQVSTATFGAELAGLDSSWLGLSLILTLMALTHG